VFRVAGARSVQIELPNTKLAVPVYYVNRPRRGVRELSRLRRRALRLPREGVRRSHRHVCRTRARASARGELRSSSAPTCCRTAITTLNYLQRRRSGA